MESLSEYLNIHTHRDYARCVIGLINLFADNPISENESVISLFEEQIKNGTLGNSLKNDSQKKKADFSAMWMIGVSPITCGVVMGSSPNRCDNQI